MSGGVEFNRQRKIFEVFTEGSKFSTFFVFPPSLKKGDELPDLYIHAFGQSDVIFRFYGEYNGDTDNLDFFVEGPLGYVYKASLQVDQPTSSPQEQSYLWKIKRHAHTQIGKDKDCTRLFVPRALCLLPKTLVGSESEVVKRWSFYGPSVPERFGKLRLKLEVTPSRCHENPDNQPGRATGGARTKRLMDDAEHMAGQRYGSAEAAEAPSGIAWKSPVSNMPAGDSAQQVMAKEPSRSLHGAQSATTEETPQMRGNLNVGEESPNVVEGGGRGEPFDSPRSVPSPASAAESDFLNAPLASSIHITTSASKKSAKVESGKQSPEASPRISKVQSAVDVPQPESKEEAPSSDAGVQAEKTPQQQQQPMAGFALKSSVTAIRPKVAPQCQAAGPDFTLRRVKLGNRVSERTAAAVAAAQEVIGEVVNEAKSYVSAALSPNTVAAYGSIIPRNLKQLLSTSQPCEVNSHMDEPCGCGGLFERIDSACNGPPCRMKGCGKKVDPSKHVSISPQFPRKLRDLFKEQQDEQEDMKALTMKGPEETSPLAKSAAVQASCDDECGQYMTVMPPPPPLSSELLDLESTGDIDIEDVQRELHDLVRENEARLGIGPDRKDPVTAAAGSPSTPRPPPRPMYFASKSGVGGGRTGITGSGAVSRPQQSEESVTKTPTLESPTHYSSTAEEDNRPAGNDVIREEDEDEANSSASTPLPPSQRESSLLDVDISTPYAWATRASKLPPDYEDESRHRQHSASAGATRSSQQRPKITRNFNQPFSFSDMHINYSKVPTARSRYRTSSTVRSGTGLGVQRINSRTFSNRAADTVTNSTNSTFPRISSSCNSHDSKQCVHLHVTRDQLNTMSSSKDWQNMYTNPNSISKK